MRQAAKLDTSHAEWQPAADCTRGFTVGLHRTATKCRERLQHQPLTSQRCEPPRKQHTQQGHGKHQGPAS
eukprot:UN2569